MEGIEQLTAFAPGIEGLDQRTSLWMNLNFPQWDSFWTFLSEIKVWIPLYTLVAILLVWQLGWKKGLVCIAAIALAFFCDERLNNLIKSLVERDRPCNCRTMLDSGIRVLRQAYGFSFPSGHSCNCFGFAISSAICLLGVKTGRKGARRRAKSEGLGWKRTYTVLIFIWAALIAVSRVMMANHYLGDVVVGAVEGLTIGSVWGIVACSLCKKLKN